MEYIFGRKRDKARKCQELGTRLAPAKLHTVDVDELATSLHDLGIDRQRGLKGGLGETDAVSAQFICPARSRA